MASWKAEKLVVKIIAEIDGVVEITAPKDDVYAAFDRLADLLDEEMGYDE